MEDMGGAAGITVGKDRCGVMTVQVGMRSWVEQKSIIGSRGQVRGENTGRGES